MKMKVFQIKTLRYGSLTIASSSLTDIPPIRLIAGPTGKAAIAPGETWCYRFAVIDGNRMPKVTMVCGHPQKAGYHTHLYLRCSNRSSSSELDVRVTNDTEYELNGLEMIVASVRNPKLLSIKCSEG